MTRGYFTFVLHSHLPYVRDSGRWPHGEEMIHEALAETYVPLLNALFDLKRDGVQPRLTLGMTPILLDQLADRDVRERFEGYLHEQIEVAHADARRFGERGEEQLRDLALGHVRWYQDARDAFVDRYGRDIVGGFRQLSDDGNLDVITSAATHAYLPLLQRDSSISAQLRVGVETTRRHFGRAPGGIWLPECGYRPRDQLGSNGSAGRRRGLEDFLADLSLEYFFADSPAIERGTPRGQVPGDGNGRGHERVAPSRTTIVRGSEKAGAPSTLRPYFIEATRVAVFGREARTSAQVWSPRHGYPGHAAYREFHRRDPCSGLQYWRVSGANVDQAAKELYDPGAALARAIAHASHFADLVCEIARRHHARNGSAGVVVAAFDTELFGHWWHEGVDWLKEVLRRLAGSETVALTTAGEALEVLRPDEVLSLPESSWGTAGDHSTWLNPETEWIWSLIHAAELAMERLVAHHPLADDWRLVALNQAARELLLLEASDWPFLITTGQARECAASRFQQHLARFDRLASIVDSGQWGSEEARFLETTAALDNPFPEIDYRVFAGQR